MTKLSIIILAFSLLASVPAISAQKKLKKKTRKSQPHAKVYDKKSKQHAKAKKQSKEFNLDD